MPYYRNAQGQVLYFSSIAYINELPPGSTVLTDDEASSALPTPLNIAIQKQIAIIDAACDADIQSGFKSSALGAVYTYPADAVDRSNLTSACSASIFPNLPANWTVLFVCTDPNGVRNMRAHTAAQIQQVGLDAMARYEKCIYQKTILETQINQAGTAEAAAAVNWISPT